MSLKTGLQHYWKMDEASGTRVDSIGTADLDDYGTTGYREGKLGNAIASTDSSDGLYTSDAVTFDGGDFTVSLWMYWDAVAGDSSPPYIVIDKTDNFRFALTTNANTGNVWWGADDSGSSITVETGGWHHVVLWYDHSESTGYHVVDDGSATSTNTGSYATNANVIRAGGTGVAGRMCGALDEVGIWNRILSSDERTQLYNGGNGLKLAGFGPKGNQVIWF